MKNYNKLFYTLFSLLFLISCEKEADNIAVLNSVIAPANISATFDITQDNTGLVSIYPNGEGVTKYQVLFGDTENEIATEYGIGEKIEHVYTEGTFNVEIKGIGISGLSSSYNQDITVTFVAPENLTVSISQDDVNPALVTVKATADYASIMDIYFGDELNEVPYHALPGEEVLHTYAEAGDYIIRVVAKSGGAATTEFSDTITVSAAADPVELPFTFESFTVNYAFTDFGGLTTTIVDNPDPSGTNVSDRVAQSEKGAGSETWAGTYLTLADPIDFSQNKLFKVDVWSPAAGIVVKLKVENMDDGNISAEVDATCSTANAWEELEFDFSTIDVNQSYHKVVIFFDFGNSGNGEIYYWDNVKLVSGNLPPVASIEDFEGTPPTFTSFGNIDNIEIIANPDVSAVNGTANCAKMIKTSGAETWAGAFFEKASPLDLDNYSKIKVKVWSPLSGIDVKVKIENSDASVTHEVDVNTAVSNGWEELSYDFSGAPAADYIRVVIFMDFGNPGDGTTYYFDEFELSN